VSEQRTPLATLPTPLVRARRLERTLGAGPLYVKRDDLTGFGVAGNKARPLEFLLGAALAERSDVFVTGGSSHSNFCAAAAMAAAVVGIDCDLLFAGKPDHSVNVELAEAAGARLLFDSGITRESVDKAVFEHAELLRVHGRQPYAVPRGGWNPSVGASLRCAAGFRRAGCGKHRRAGPAWSRIRCSLHGRHSQRGSGFEA
jgi:1-aminocyclopropane-1-carboxylate deaminase/D-cysteine desulfhydrase-like pyridoxal-dependent ACC family enzyme